MLAHALATVTDCLSQMTWHNDCVPPSAVANSDAKCGWHSVVWVVETGKMCL